MTEANQIRINELARDLEVKAKAILDYLPEAGVAEKKTHSSSIDLAAAEKVRAHFRQLAEEEAAAEANAQAEKAAKEAAAKAARLRPAAPSVVAPAGPKAPATVPAAAKPPVPAVAKPTVPGAAPVRPSAVPAAPGATSAAPLPPAAAQPAKPSPAPPMPAVAPRPATPSTVRPAASAPPGGVARPPMRPAAPAGAGAPVATRSAAPGIAARSGGAPTGAPAARPGMGAPGARMPMRHPSARPGTIPVRPGSVPPRPGQRPMRPGAPVLPLPVVPPPKAEPGKPIYERKPAARARPTLEKRFEEGERKLHPVRTRPGVTERRATRIEPVAQPPRPPREITITEGITVRELAEKLDVRAKDVLKDLLDRGVFASINQALDVPTATSLAEAFSGIVSVVSFEEEVVQEVAKEEKKENLEPRPPVVTVMGHVDHGKTSLLDAIRQTDVAAGEAGGITQHIGASVVSENGRRIVFIDTPGHEAFTRMRARGAKVTDLVVLVVAADDGIMPQTLEAVDHARAAGVPIVVAINKVDKPEAQPERVKRQLADRGLMPEEWGGDTVVVEVSAREKKNLDKLLEMILLVADLRELRANPSAPASGTVLESRVDRGRGPVATVLVQNGTLHTGDVFIVGAVYGKVRALFDDHGHAVKKADPSTPVEVLGLQGVPEAGDHFQVADEAKARHIVDYRQTKLREASLARSAGTRITLDQLHEQLKSGETKELPIVIKADVQGSVEVLSELLPKLSTDQVKLKIIHASVGAVTETDVLLASASGAIIFAFNVRPDRKAADLAQRENVDIRMHSIIYEVTDEIKRAMTGLLEPVYKETHLGRAEVRDTFRIKGVGMIAGCYVLDGIVKRDAEVRVVREGVVIYTGRVSSLRRFKEDANEVRSGFECGVGVSNFNDIKVGDVLECFSMQKQILAEATA
ncbi:MAG: translation initiation factor IF-2 [Acidobacteria bacterium]|nr:MAG: translation initiation factor IF-2 [Acidobacteriota bacterium]